MLDERTLRYRRPEAFFSGRGNSRRRSTIGPLWHSASDFGEPSNGSEQLAEGADGSISSTDDPTRRRQRPSLLSSFSRRSLLFDLAEEERKDDMFLSGSSEIVPVEGSFFYRWRFNREIYQEDYSRSVEVSQQALFYLGTFYLTHIWSTTTRILQHLGVREANFFLVLVHSWFDPFQGFLNYLVYQRPRYMKIRGAHRDQSRAKAMLRALQFSSRLDSNASLSLTSHSRNTATRSSSRRRASDLSTTEVETTRRVNFSRAQENSTSCDDQQTRASELTTILEDPNRILPSTLELIQANRFAEAHELFASDLRSRMESFRHDRVNL